MESVQKSGSLLAKHDQLIAADDTKLINYPEARRDETISDVYHGVEIQDPYRWLENPDTEETKKFVDVQNEYTRPYLDSHPDRDSIYKRIKSLWDYPKYSCPFHHGNKYFFHKNTGLQNQSVLYVQDDLSSEAKVLLDPNIFCDEGTVALSGTEFSEDGKTLAYGLRRSGSDWLTIQFRNVETGEDYPETLTKVKFSPMTWTHDNKGIFYGAYPEQLGKTDGSETDCNMHQKLYYHKVGTNPAEDVLCVQFLDEPQYRIGAEVSDCGRYIIISPVKDCKNNLVYYCDLEKVGEIKSFLPLTQIVFELHADYEYITNTGSIFIFRTNYEAPNYRLIKIDLDKPEKENWITLLEDDDKDVLDWATPINNNQLVTCYIHDVKSTMQLRNLEDCNVIAHFPLQLGTVVGFSGKKKHTDMFYQFTSFLTPGQIFYCDLKDQITVVPELFREVKVDNFDPSEFETSQVFYESLDKTKIPMFIINKKGVVPDGSQPCLLYGYGGFNVSIQPTFSVSRIVFVQNFNGILAIANIRGGGEYGENWHNAGRFFRKQNVFDDFKCAAKYLIKEKYTCKEKLSIQGGSNGGLLVAACINQAPHLFGAAICQVGVLDMLRYHKFTIGYAWKSDYGSSEEEKHFHNLLKYSPLHNTKVPADNEQYPATLLLTADHDDRVVPLHSLKYIAQLQHTLQHYAYQKNPIMIRIETRAGHGSGKPTTKVIDELTDIFCFISRSLNIPFEK